MTVPCGVATLICRLVDKEIDLIQPADMLKYHGVEILLGLRKGAHGAGMWALPGGRIEPGEKPNFAAEREVLEETGLIVVAETLEMVPYNNTFAGGQPWVTLYFIAWIEDGTPEVMEPDKCERFEWFEWGSFPEPLFEPLAALVERVNEMRRR